MIRKRCIQILFLFPVLTGCTTNYPQTVGALGGAAAGAGVGGLVAASSSSISTAQGVGFGALIGIPVGIGVAYASDASAKYYILKTNTGTIEDNHEMIIANQAVLNEARYETYVERPKGNPDPDRAEYLYVGPRLGNPWR